MEYHGHRVTIMGLGHFGGGATAARWLAEQGISIAALDTEAERLRADGATALFVGVDPATVAPFHGLVAPDGNELPASALTGAW